MGFDLSKAHCPKCGGSNVVLATEESVFDVIFSVRCRSCGLETGWYSLKDDVFTAWDDMRKMGATKPINIKFKRVDDVVFGSHRDALLVLCNMKNLISRYGSVTVQDYFDLAEVTTYSEKDADDYGWVNLSDASIDVYCGTGEVKLNLPTPILLK